MFIMLLEKIFNAFSFIVRNAFMVLIGKHSFSEYEQRELQYLVEVVKYKFMKWNNSLS